MAPKLFGAIFFIFFVANIIDFNGRNRIALVKPSRQIYIGAAAGTKWAIFFILWFATHMTIFDWDIS